MIGPPDSPADSDAPVVIVPYDDAWPAKFAAERARLETALSPWLTAPIEHVGSTAVAGLPAKPIIDIMAPVRSLQASRPAIDAATAAGYVYFPYKADVMHWFCKPSPAFRTHHLHLVPHESPLWRERIAFRDALCDDPGLAREYADLKFDLAARFRDDREAYADAKGTFIRHVLAALHAD